VGLRIFAVLTVFAGVTWLYVTWKPVWKWIENELMLSEILLGAVGTQPLTPAGAETKPPAGSAQQQAAARAAATRQAQQRLGSIAIGWLGWTSLVGLWLVMCGGAGLFRNRVFALLGMVLTPMLLGLIVWLAYHVQVEYAWLESLLPAWVRPTFAALGLALALSVGFILQTWRLGLLRTGGILVILSAALTVAGLWAALRWGGLPAEAFDTRFYVKTFALQSAYGWILLIGAFRLR
jgi:hypothetical protein